MKSISLFCLAMCAALLLSSQNGYAQDASPGEGLLPKRHYVRACRRWKNTLRKAHLSEMQKESVAAAIESFFEETGEYRDNLIEAEKTLLRLVFNPKEIFDEETIRSAHQEVATNREEIILESAELMDEFQSILNSKQYLLFLIARHQMLICFRAPRAHVSRTIEQWVEENLED